MTGKLLDSTIHRDNGSLSKDRFFLFVRYVFVQKWISYFTLTDIQSMDQPL